MVLTIMAATHTARILSLDKLANLLPSPLRPLHGKRAAPLALPDNIICFCRRSAADLNRPQSGRALHHRFVLILALETAVTVAVDDRAIRLNPGEGLLVLPFQFHDYIQPGREELRWLFITFDMVDAAPLQALRFRPFVITPVIRQTGAELVEAYLTRGEGDLTSLLLAVLLQRIRQAEPILRRHQKPSVTPGMIMQVNQLALTSDIDLTVEENLSIYAKLYGVPAADRKRNIDDLLKTVDLLKWRNAQTKTLSGGMRRRLEIARGLVHRSEERRVGKEGRS